MSSSLNTTTCLLICGKNLNAELIFARFVQRPISITRQGEVILPNINHGALRNYDSRLGLDCCKYGLTSKQYKYDIVKQLEFWIEKLYPFRSSFKEFKELGYWSMIDCQISSLDQALPSIQFRLTSEMQLKLSVLSVDIDFTIYRPVQ
jgi:hypothetical protein